MMKLLRLDQNSMGHVAHNLKAIKTFYKIDGSRLRVHTSDKGRIVLSMIDAYNLGDPVPPEKWFEVEWME